MIEKRKEFRMLLKLKEKEKEWQGIFDSITDLASVHDRNLKILRVNRSFANTFKMKPKDFIGKTCHEIFHGTKEPFLLCPHKKILETKKSTTVEVFESRLGTYFEISISPILNEKGEITACIHIAKNITKRKRIEQELRQAEEKYRMQFKEALDAIFLADAESGILIDCNPAASKLVGRKRLELIGQHQRILHPLTERTEGKFTRTYKQHLKEKEGQAIETQIITKTGEIKEVSIKASLFKLDSKKVMQAIFREITESKKAEEELKKAYSRLSKARMELIQAEKANAIVQLAGGIAHEVKNPLAIIMQANEYLERNVTSRKKNMQETLHTIKDNVKRIDNIIRALADFVRITELNLKLQDVKPVIAHSLDLIKYRVKFENIKIVKELKKDLPKVLIDSAKIEQVFVNLFLNAVQAMPNGGKIFIRGYPTKLEKPQNRVGRRSSDYFRLGEKVVIIEIEDTGMGIPKENLQKIFTPFFTTKGPRGGAGLGLSVTKSIIDIHRGMIEMQSEENKGTKFIITLKTHGGE